MATSWTKPNGTLTEGSRGIVRILNKRELGLIRRHHICQAGEAEGHFLRDYLHIRRRDLQLLFDPARAADVPAADHASVVATRELGQSPAALGAGDAVAVVGA